MTDLYKQDNDKLYRFLFKNRAVRGEWVRLNKTFRNIKYTSLPNTCTKFTR